MADGIQTSLPSVAKARAAGPHKFTRAEFWAVSEAGIIAEGDRVELIAGEIIHMPSEGYLHGNGAALLVQAIQDVLPAQLIALMNTRLDVDDHTEVYPDILVCPKGTLVQARNAKTIALIVEVADSSLARDRDVKGPLYAAAGFQEYWIYEPAHRRIWVHREPMSDGRWGLIFKREGAETLATLIAPDHPLAIPILPPDTDAETGA
jgi:Uma2 family endonuclease